MLVFHVSPNRNRDSILLQGLSLDFCRTRKLAIHCVRCRMLTWAVDHVARRHGVQAADLDVWIVPCRLFVSGFVDGGKCVIPATVWPADLAGVLTWPQCRTIIDRDATAADDVRADTMLQDSLDLM